MQPQLIAGRYQVLRGIGHGGMGIVWLCRDEILGREVAVKQIGALPGESANETKRAMREARSAAALNHPNAVAVYDVVTHDGRPWLVMEYVEGQTLADEIARDGQVSPQRVADIGAQLAGALARAHERRIVHRDIKPGNVLIDKAGRPKISDFGIARGHGDDQLTQTGFVTGTPGYLSPELARGGDPDSASDVWALGATLYAAVEGRAAYASRSNPIALLMAIATERPRPMTHTGALRFAIETMMHEEPAERWDMATIAQRLGRIAGGGATAVMPRTQSPAAQAKVPAPVEPTKRLESTQRLDEVAAELEATQAAQVIEATQAAKVQEATQAAKVVEAEQEATQAAPTPSPQVGVSAVARSKSAPKAKAPVVPAPIAVVPVVAGSSAERSHGGGDSEGGVTGVPAHRERTGRRRLPVVLVALLVGALGVVFLLSQLGDKGSNVVPGTPIAATRPAAAPPTGTDLPKTAEPTKVAIPAPSSTPVVPAPTPAPAPASDSELKNFVSSYYSDVTQDTNRTWALLTPRMQAAAGGRKGYDGFWSTIKKVNVQPTQVNAAANTAVVRLSFTGKNGARSTETHRFTFVNQGGRYLIDSERRG